MKLDSECQEEVSVLQVIGYSGRVPDIIGLLCLKDKFKSTTFSHELYAISARRKAISGRAQTRVKAFLGRRTET